MIRSSMVVSKRLQSQNATQVLGSSVQRVGIVFSPPAAGQYTLSNSSPIGVGDGIVLTAGGPPLEFTVEKNGDCVQRAWFIYPSTAPMYIAYLETVEHK